MSWTNALINFFMKQLELFLEKSLEEPMRDRVEESLEDIGKKLLFGFLEYLNIYNWANSWVAEYEGENGSFFRRDRQRGSIFSSISRVFRIV